MRCGRWGARPPASVACASARAQRVIALLVLGEGHVLTASENGYGKLTPLEEFPGHGRGGQGVIALQTTERNGATVAALQVLPQDELMLISSTGTLVRTPVADISVVGRNTQGVRLIRLGEGERLTGIERVAALEAGEEGRATRRRQSRQAAAATDDGRRASDTPADELRARAGGAAALLQSPPSVMSGTSKRNRWLACAYSTLRPGRRRCRCRCSSRPETS